MIVNMFGAHCQPTGHAESCNTLPEQEASHVGVSQGQEDTEEHLVP